MALPAETPPAPPAVTAATGSFSIPTSDGKGTITFDATQAPDLRDWARQTLAPVLAEWYPKIVAMLPSAGYTAPAHFSVTLKPMDGVAYTADNQVVANSVWLKSELGREAVGSLIHESVHVVQQFGNHGGDNPGWLVEGTADYIRWFKYEPRSHGADLIWMRGRQHFSPHYNDSYRVTANFLNWVTERFDPRIVEELNAAMREGRYEESLWQRYTGRTAPELGEQWRQEILAQLAGPPAANPAN
jgi:hypothetical protein